MTTISARQGVNPRDNGSYRVDLQLCMAAICIVCSTNFCHCVTNLSTFWLDFAYGSLCAM